MTGKFGGRTRTRTWDLLIKSQLLYQLSYAPALDIRPVPNAILRETSSGSPSKLRETYAERARFSKAPPYCLETAGSRAR